MAGNKPSLSFAANVKGRDATVRGPDDNLVYVVGLLIAAVYAVWAYPDSFLDDISNYATWILVFWSNAVLLVIMRDTK